jgi:hypothetical protein
MFKSQATYLKGVPLTIRRAQYLSLALVGNFCAKRGPQDLRLQHCRAVSVSMEDETAAHLHYIASAALQPRHNFIHNALAGKVF